MQQVYLVRHGESESFGMGKPDTKRRLTSGGQKDIRLLSSTLKKEPIKQIYHSPYVRTCETAAILNEAFELELRDFMELVPGGSPEMALDLTLGVEGDLILVTHLPLVAELAELFSGERITFFPGSCARLLREDSHSRTAKLDWVKHPRI